MSYSMCSIEMRALWSELLAPCDSRRNRTPQYMLFEAMELGPGALRDVATPFGGPGGSRSSMSGSS